MTDRAREQAEALNSAALNLHQAAEAYAEALGFGDDDMSEHLPDLDRYFQQVDAALRAVKEAG